MLSHVCSATRGCWCRIITWTTTIWLASVNAIASLALRNTSVLDTWPDGTCWSALCRWHAVRSFCIPNEYGPNTAMHRARDALLHPTELCDDSGTQGGSAGSTLHSASQGSFCVLAPSGGAGILLELGASGPITENSFTRSHTYLLPAAKAMTDSVIILA